MQMCVNKKESLQERALGRARESYESQAEMAKWNRAGAKNSQDN